MNWTQMVYLSGLAKGIFWTRYITALPGFNCYFAPGTPPGVTAASLAAAIMFEDTNYGGFGLSLPEGFFWPDLSLVIRHDFGYGNRVSWNDAISSLRPTTSLCAYYENPNLSGTIRIVVPGVEMLDLDFLGFNDIISSVINFGPP